MRERIGAMLCNRYLDRVLAMCELDAKRLSDVGVRAAAPVVTIPAQ